MTDDQTPPNDAHGADDLDGLPGADLAALLGTPGLWDDPDSSIEDSIVAAIAAEAPAQPTTRVDPVAAPTAPSAPTGQPATITPISAARRWGGPILAAAAAFLLLLGGFALFNRDAGVDGIEVALEATDLAPGADATAVVSNLPNGTRLLLDVSDLPPAPAGQYYEAWLRKSPEVGVSAGTFHMRGGDGEIELWAGVGTADYPLLTVTLQDEAQTESSGRVVLKVLLES